MARVELASEVDRISQTVARRRKPGRSHRHQSHRNTSEKPLALDMGRNATATLVALK